MGMLLHGYGFADEADEPEFATLAGLCFQIDLSDEAVFLYTRLEFSLQVKEI